MMPGGALAGETTADVRHLKGRQVIEDVADPGARVVFGRGGQDGKVYVRNRCRDRVEATPTIPADPRTRERPVR